MHGLAFPISCGDGMLAEPCHALSNQSERKKSQNIAMQINHRTFSQLLRSGEPSPEAELAPSLRFSGIHNVHSIAPDLNAAPTAMRDFNLRFSLDHHGKTSIFLFLSLQECLTSGD